MNFSSYMNDWLYGVDGYYANFKAIGKGGDFYTAVSTSAFFGASIANYLLSIISQDLSKQNGYLVEIGAHKGYLICDIIQWIYSVQPEMLKTIKFAIIEKHTHIQEAQKEYVKSRFGDEVTIEHFDSIAKIDTDYAFVVSNEIFDAFPCELIKDEKIATVKNHSISWSDIDENRKLWAKNHHLTQGEIAVGYEEFANEFNHIKKCDFVSFDYGEKYVRNDFSIRVYEQHQVFPLFDEKLNLEQSYKNSDITYDVNFSHVMEAFEGARFETLVYETQARALIRFGIIDILEQFAKQTTQTNYLREADKIKTLISPTIMGDRFKMIHLIKNR